MTEQATARQVIRAAIAAAGGMAKAGPALGISPQTVSAWAARGRVPSEWIKPLCDLGGNVVKPTQILEALARCAREKAAA
jgi:hypothetical protein